MGTQKRGVSWMSRLNRYSSNEKDGNGETSDLQDILHLYRHEVKGETIPAGKKDSSGKQQQQKRKKRKRQQEKEKGKLQKKPEDKLIQENVEDDDELSWMEQIEEQQQEQSWMERLRDYKAVKNEKDGKVKKEEEQ